MGPHLLELLLPATLAMPMNVASAPAATPRSCELPAYQQLKNAQKRMGSERTVEFPIEPYPALGTITTEIFIEAREGLVDLDFEFTNPNMLIGPILKGVRPDVRMVYGDKDLNVPGVYGQGDGRRASFRFKPEKTRAFAVLDFAAGRGYVLVNKSVTKLRTSAPLIGPMTPYHQSWHARKTYRQWGGANSWIWADWIDGDRYRLRTHLTESVFGSSWVTPSIDVQVVIDKNTRQAKVQGDSFPSVGVHHVQSCTTLADRREDKFAGLYDFDSADSIAPGPRNAKPSAPEKPAGPGPNKEPVAKFTHTRRYGAGNLVALDGRGSSDPDGRVVTWRWFRGGKQIAIGPVATVALGADPTQQVTLRVTDDRGATAEVAKSLRLGNRAPAIAALSPGAAAVTGSTTPVLGAVPLDPDGEALQYEYRVTGPQVDLSSGWVGGAWQVPAHKLDPGTRYEWTVTVRDARGATAKRTSHFVVAMLPTAADAIATPTGLGYWQVDTQGRVTGQGDAGDFGSLPGINVSVNDVIGMARTPTGRGYWLVGRNGGVYAFGDAAFHGALPGKVDVGNIVAMAVTPDGGGYWLVGTDGGVFSFGNAKFHGSTGGQKLNAPVVGIAPTRTGGGYWLAAKDGGVFSFGDAVFHGSTGDAKLNAPVVDIDPAPDGDGYWLAAEDGGVFTFGSAGFHGSLAGTKLNGHITGLAATQDGYGYYLNGCDGGIFAFGNAVFRGRGPEHACRGT